VFDNPVLFALMTYGLTIIIAFMVGGIITLIGWVIKSRGKKATEEE